VWPTKKISKKITSSHPTQKTRCAMWPCRVSCFTSRGYYCAWVTGRDSSVAASSSWQRFDAWCTFVRRHVAGVFCACVAGVFERVLQACWCVCVLQLRGWGGSLLRPSGCESHFHALLTLHDGIIWQVGLCVWGGSGGPGSIPKKKNWDRNTNSHGLQV